MSDQKLSDLTAETTIAPDDLVMAVDVSDTTMAATGTNKKVLRESLQTYNAGTLTTDKKVLDLSATWNESGTTFTGVKFNATDTASAAGSLIADLQVGGSSKFTVGKIGDVISFAGGFRAIAPSVTTNIFQGRWGSSLIAYQVSISSGIPAVDFNSFGLIRWSNSTGNVSPIDTVLARDAADTLAQRRTTNAQTFRLYESFTDASNYTRGSFAATANGFDITPEAAGTGSKRPVRILGHSLASAEAVSALEVNQTWNTTGTPTAVKLNVTDTASASTSRLLDLQVGGTTVFSVGKNGAISINPSANGGNITGSFGTSRVEFKNNSLAIIASTSAESTTTFNFATTGIVIPLAASFGFASAAFSASPDTFLFRDAANTLAQRNATNAQTFRLYNSFTDASNFERGKMQWDSNVLKIGTEKAGAGSARALELQTDGTTRLTIAANGASITIPNQINTANGLRLTAIANGTLGLGTSANAAGSLVFGYVASSAFPQLKTSSTTLQVRLADDSADAPFSAAAGTFSGVVTAPNLANGRSMGRFTPLDNQPPAANFATLDTRNSIAVLDFDAGTDEAAVFVGVIPQAATLTSGIKVRISWAATSATSGDCVWGAQFEKTTGEDIDADSFDTATTATTTTSGTSGVVNTTEITCTTIDSLAAGDTFRIKIYRDADAGGDTMTGDAELVAVELQQVA